MHWLFFFCRTMDPPRHGCLEPLLNMFWSNRAPLKGVHHRILPSCAVLQTSVPSLRCQQCTANLFASLIVIRLKGVQKTSHIRSTSCKYLVTLWHSLCRLPHGNHADTVRKLSSKLPRPSAAVEHATTLLRSASRHLRGTRYSGKRLCLDCLNASRSE